MDASTSTYASKPEPSSLFLSNSSNWKIPAELLITTTIQMGLTFPDSIMICSMAAAETEWMLIFPAWKGMRDRPSSNLDVDWTVVSHSQSFKKERYYYLLATECIVSSSSALTRSMIFRRLGLCRAGSRIKRRSCNLSISQLPVSMTWVDPASLSVLSLSCMPILLRSLSVFQNSFS